MKIAVIGIGCRYPGAHSASEFFENVLAGRRGFREMPAERWPKEDYYHPDKNHPDTTYCKKAALVENFDFNPSEFRIPKSTYLATDTAQWMSLKVAQEALIDAGINPEEHQNTGVIIGNTLTGEVSRASLMRYRWPYTRRVFSELLDNFGIQGDEKKHLLKRIEARYKAPFPTVNEDNLAGGLSNTIAGRICNFFDFKGGGFSTDGACSSSLLAINQACIGLVSNNCDLALAGGVDISLDPFEMVGFAKVGALSNTDIRVYDQFSNGFLPGEGCGIVVLQRYEDAVAQGKSIYAVVNGIGISSDGKGGITAPSVSGQLLAVSSAYRMADYKFSDVELIEGHGTGTPTGDKVELSTFVESKKQSEPEDSHRCGIGSIKSNLGHTKAAAGVAGFIKTLMSVCHGILPPTQGIQTPNELFKQSEYLYPLVSGRRWYPSDGVGTGSTRKAAVSSAGFGGINTHITLSSDEDIPSRATDEERNRYLSLLHTGQSSEVFFIGAESRVDMSNVVATVLDAAKRISMGELIDLSYYCAHTMSANRIRLSIVAQNPELLVEKLEVVSQYLASSDSEHDVEYMDHVEAIYLKSATYQPRIAYLFPGQASQSLNMGRRLKSRCSSLAEFWSNGSQNLKNILHEDIEDLVFRDADAVSETLQKEWKGKLNQTAITQPAVTLASLASAAHLRELGLRPDLAIGHSLGEYAALCSAGVLTVEQTLALVAARGRAMADSNATAGAMVSVGANVERVRELLDDIKRAAFGQNDFDGTRVGTSAADKASGSDDVELVIANINSPSQTIVSGESLAIDRLIAHCQTLDLPATRLSVSSAFHSKMMEKASNEMATELGNYRFGRLRHLVISPCTGDFVSDSENLAEMLTEQILKPVDFIGAMELAEQEECDVYIEVGPGKVLSGLAKSTIKNRDALVCSSDIGDRGQSSEGLNQLSAYLYACGEPLNKQKLFEGRFFREFSLPYEKRFIPSPCEFEVPPLDLGLKEGALTDGLSLDLSAFKDTDTVDQESNEAVDADGEEAILALLRKQIVKTFGYSEDMLVGDAKLQDDLGLDSLKSVELAHEVMGAVGVQADVSHMQNASLEVLASYIYQLSTGEATGGLAEKDSAVDLVMPEWVNAFEMLSVAKPLDASSTLKDQGNDSVPEGQLLSGKFLLVYENKTAIVEALKETLEKMNISVVIQQLVLDKAPAIDFPTPFDFNACIYIVNDTQSIDGMLSTSENAVARRMVRPQYLLKVGAALAKLTTKERKSFTLIGADKVSVWGATVKSNDCYSEAGAGFVKTLHLEHPEINTCCINNFYELDHLTASAEIIEEIKHCDGHLDVSIGVRSDVDADSDRAKNGKKMERHVALYTPSVVSQLPKSEAPLEEDDVVLITGGGKGITAECALRLAQVHGVKLALVGSSEATKTGGSDELSTNLRRFDECFSSSSKKYKYYACNVLNGHDVKKLMEQISQDLGPVRAIIHGAGVNGLQKISHAKWDVFERVLKPKMEGLVNLIAASNLASLKSLMVFSSVIATSGMAGNAEYAYANEWMNQVLRRIKQDYPQLDCRAFGFSAWSEVGMADRLKSVDLLAHMGIGSIPVKQGCELFLDLIDKSWPDTQLVISSRMGSLDTLEFNDTALAKNRFVEKVLHSQPKIELLSEVFLDPEHDRYLADHVYDGSFLFPAVMGIEAMVQCASACRGSGIPPSLAYSTHTLPELTNLKFSRAIIVPPEGRDIRIYVQLSPAQANGEQHGKVFIRSSVTQYKQDYFSADCVWGSSSGAPKNIALSSSDALDLSPANDLYGKILFQGEMFQNIKSYRELSSTHCVVDITLPKENLLFSFLGGDASENKTAIVFGSGQVRDTFLHAVQLCVPEHRILPISMERVIYRGYEDACADEKVLTLYAVEREKTTSEFLYDLEIYDSNGFCVEEIRGFRCRIMGDYSDLENLKSIQSVHRASESLYSLPGGRKVGGPKVEVA